MFINFKNHTIEMTNTEVKAASKFNSDAYNELKAIRNDFPTFSISIKKSVKRHIDYKGLSYSYMEKYIQRKSDEDALSFYYSLIGKGESQSFETASYFEVKKWFLGKFPEVKTPRQMIEDNLNSQVA